MPSLRLLPLLLLPLFALPACDPAPATDEEFGAPQDGEDADFRGWGHGVSGPVINTSVVNGTSTGALRFAAPTAHGTHVSLIWSVVHGEAFDLATVEVVDGALQGVTASGQVVDAFGFEGSLWLFETANGTSVVTLEEVAHAEDVGLANYGSKIMTNLDPARVVYKWTSPDAPALGTKVDPKTGWGGTYDGLHTCPNDPQADTWSILYRGMAVEADGDVLSMYYADQYAYLACLSGRIGKAALWGYAPDNPSPTIPDLSFAEFEGAHRMVGAEYCGDGRSYTRAGEAVTLKDKWTINVHEGSATATEAVWSISRAVCVGAPRWEIYSGPILCADGTTIPSCSSITTQYTNNASAKWWTKNAIFPD